jgi:hypothetical protein
VYKQLTPTMPSHHIREQPFTQPSGSPAHVYSLLACSLNRCHLRFTDPRDCPAYTISVASDISTSVDNAAQAFADCVESLRKHWLTQTPT